MKRSEFLKRVAIVPFLSVFGVAYSRENIKDEEFKLDCSDWLIPNRYYGITFTVNNYVRGNLVIDVGGNKYNMTNVAGNGCYDWNVQAGDKHKFIFFPDSCFEGEIWDLRIRYMQDLKNIKNTKYGTITQRSELKFRRAKWIDQSS